MSMLLDDHHRKSLAKKLGTLSALTLSLWALPAVAGSATTAHRPAKPTTTLHLAQASKPAAHAPVAAHKLPVASKPIARPTAKPGLPTKTPIKMVTAKPGLPAKIAARPAARPAVGHAPIRVVPGARATIAARPGVQRTVVIKPAPLPPDAGNEAPLPAPDDPKRDRILRLREALDGIVRGPVLGRLRVGLRVLDLATGQVLYSRRGGVLMDPASNQKVLATATALLRLGSTWRFRTEVMGAQPDGDGVIAGDVIVRGSGDPSLRPSHLEDLATTLAHRGVTRVDGRILGDVRRIGSDEPASGRAPLRVGWSAIEIRVRPGERVGAHASASVWPPSDLFQLSNQAVTAKGRSRVNVALNRVGDRFQVVVTGKMGLGRPAVVLRREPPSSALHAAILLRSALVQNGIEVRGGVGSYSGDHGDRQAALADEPEILLASAAPRSDSGLPLGRLSREHTLDVLAVHESAPLSVIIRKVNKESNNEWAERVLEAVGAELYGGAATTSKGVHALREALTDLGLSPAVYNPANGSGLGHQNRITPAGMADLLRRLFLDPRVGPDMLQSLSVGGVDGTTRNRFRGSSSAQRVRAKTGTLNGVSCLSGYVGYDSDVAVFSIMVEGHRKRAVTSVRAAQVSAVNAMMKFARGAQPAATTDEGQPTDQDYETGEEPAAEDESGGAGES
jgi:D-alanyl-D-alanine carboxypeptidase/D-alanyl-D-alanine-endopeptidase (penicillin-binding protein 4)